jgi:uncharacterized protein with PIN domain
MKFITDCMLGTLAKWLRILGYDTLYYRFIEDTALIQKALRTQRTLLTRDEEVFRKFKSPDKLLIQSDDVMSQLKQVIEEKKLEVGSQLFTRCVLCNTRLIRVDKEEIQHLVPEYVFKTQQEFSICNHCKKIYWKGTHRTRMMEKLKNLEESLKL